MAFAKRSKNWAAAGRRLWGDRAEEAITQDAEEPAHAEPAAAVAVVTADPDQRLLTALGRFQRQIGRATSGTAEQVWCDECMDQLITGIEIAAQQGWDNVREALTDTARILQSYEEHSRASQCVDFLQDSYEILCLMVGDLIVDNVRSGVTKKWRERYAEAVYTLRQHGLSLVDDEGEPEPDYEQPRRAMVQPATVQHAVRDMATADRIRLHWQNQRPVPLPDSLEQDDIESEADIAFAFEEQAVLVEEMPDDFHPPAIDDFMEEPTPDVYAEPVEELEADTVIDVAEDVVEIAAEAAPFSSSDWSAEERAEAAGSSVEAAAHCAAEMPTGERPEEDACIEPLPAPVVVFEPPAMAMQEFETELSVDVVQSLEEPEEAAPEIVDEEMPYEPPPVTVAAAPVAPPAPPAALAADFALQALLATTQAALARGDVADAKILALQLAASMAKLEADRAEADVETAEAELDDNEHALHAAEEALQRAERSVLQAETQISQREAEYKERQDEVLALRESVESIELTIAGYEEQIRRLQSQVEAERDRQDALSADLDEALATSTLTQTEMDSLHAGAEAARHRLQEANSTINRLREERRLQQAAIAQAREQVQKRRVSAAEINDTITRTAPPPAQQALF